MARKSRKKLFENESRDKELNAIKTENEPKVYNTAAYVRLSAIKNENEESIENQIEIIEEFISRNNELKLVEIYSDKKKTGRDFERPEFVRLMNDVRTGKINCIVVKDLSRFGRNFVEAGNYIERVFPYLNVRLISVTDNFDTNNSDVNSLMIAFKNLINEFYSRDLSKKIKGSLLPKQLEGKYLGGFPPYGYMRDPKDKYKLIPDKNTAPTVKRIFKMKLKGLGCREISGILNSEYIPSPYNYNYNIKEKDDENYRFWSESTVGSILENRVYIGCCVSKKRKRISFSSKKTVECEESEMIVVKDVFEPIIDKNTFDKVTEAIKNQKALCKRKKQECRNYKDLLCGKIYCDVCGKKLYYKSKISKANGEVYASYYCYFHNHYGNTACKNRSFVSGNYIKNVIYLYIRHILMIYAFIYDKDLSKTENGNIADKCKKITADNKSIVEDTKNKKLKLFESYSNKIISEEEYLLEKSKLDKIEEKFFSKAGNGKIIREKLKDFKEEDLTQDMIDFLVEKIIVGENRRVEIKFNFKDIFRGI